MLRTFVSLSLVGALSLTTAAWAQSQPPRERSARAVALKAKPARPLPARDSCADYGAGFVRVEGSNTCVKVGGAVSIGGGWSR